MSAAVPSIRLPVAGILHTLVVAVVTVAAIAAVAGAALVVGGDRLFALAGGAAGVALELSAALVLTAAGVVALIRRRPFALIVIAIGGTWAARELANPAAPGPVVFTLGLLLGAAWIPLVGWLALAYPQRVPEGRRDRWAIAIGFIATLAPALVRTAMYDPASAGCAACPANLLMIHDAAAVAAAAADTGKNLALLTCVLFLVAVIARWRRVSPAERLLITPVSATTAAALGSLLAGSVFAAMAGTAGPSIIRAAYAAVSISLVGIAIAVSWETVRIATARRRSARLVSDLSNAPRPGQLSRRLGAITHDDSLELTFPLGDRVVDVEGRTTADPRQQADDRMRRVTVAVGRDGSELAVLTHRPGLLDDLGFREAVTRAAGLALEHERLQAELASRVRDLRESRARLVESFDAERRRLEHDLHDGAQQQMVALLLGLRLAQGRNPRPELESAIVDVTEALAELRNLAHGIYPAALGEEGLGAALNQLREGAAIPVKLVGVQEGRWPEAVETTAYVVVAETLRRSGLRAAVVDVTERAGMLHVTVSGDRDHDFEPAGYAEGVAGLVDRVGAVGGDIRIDDGLVGTLTVSAELPCGS